MIRIIDTEVDHKFKFMNKVTVIIPVYNEEETIGECLESLVKQSYRDMEIIVIDDGSTDNTAGEIGRITNHELRIAMLREKHRGAGAARNLGAKRARGEILVFVDADMTFDRKFIEMLVRPIVKGEAIGTFSKKEFLANSENVWAKCWNINRNLPPTKMHPERYPDTQKVFRAILKAKFDEAGGFDEKAGYTDDWSLSEKLGLEAVNAPNAIFYHENPDTLRDVFIQSKWMAKRRYKMGMLGVLVALVRVSLPFSFILGILYALTYTLPSFIIFKLVSDLGQFIGILEYLLKGKVAK